MVLRKVQHGNKMIVSFAQRADGVTPQTKRGQNFDSGIVKTIEWYLNKYGANK